MQEWNKAYISFGSNLGDREENIREALGLIEENQKVKTTKISLLYETEPVGLKGQPWFLNGIAEIETPLLPEELLLVLQGIEQGLARVRDLNRGPRTIDLDIILFGDRVVDVAGLKIPHPQMHKRNFVLIPMSEIAPERRHPVLNRSIEELLIECPDTSEVKRWQE